MTSTTSTLNQTHLGSSLDDWLAEDGLKYCPKCGETKDRSEFYKDQKSKDGLQSQCKECQKARAKTYCKTEAYRATKAAYEKTEAGKATKRRVHLRRKYGLTEEGFQSLLDSQGGRCACCGTDRPGGHGNQWHIDHCHETEKIRGLLCNNCNVGAGRFGDNLEGALLHTDYMIRTCSTTEEMTPELETKLAAISLKIQLLLAGVK